MDMAITTDQIKDLREATGAGILDCRTALEQSGGDYEKAVDYLREKGLAKAAKKAGREASEGVVELYSHGGGRVGVIVEVNCETDFVSRSEAFRALAHEIALQIAAGAPGWVNEDELPEAVLEREREVARNRAIEEGKSKDVAEKMLDGRIQKYLDEVVLLRQAYIRDESKTIQDLLSEAIGAIGENILIRRFERWELGEHVENE
jgi:elongation factor Ts